MINRVAEEATGQKYDVDKPRFDLMDPWWYEDVAKVITHGAMKYAPDNWKNVARHRYIAALERHITALKKGEHIDSESGLPHTALASCNLMFIHYFDRVSMEATQVCR
jgi:hypothetical protein